jgi:hypothetical protein
MLKLYVLLMVIPGNLEMGLHKANCQGNLGMYGMFLDLYNTRNVGYVLFALGMYLMVRCPYRVTGACLVAASVGMGVMKINKWISFLKK